MEIKLPKLPSRKKAEPLPIDNIRIPILVLDKAWHNMFPNELKTEKLKQQEKRVMALLKERGKLTTDTKKYELRKKNLLKRILELTTDVFYKNDGNAKDEMGKSQEYVVNINGKFEEMDSRLDEVEAELKQANLDLFWESVVICYGRINESESSLHTIDSQIQKLREVLKKRVEDRVMHEEVIRNSYAFLHKFVSAGQVNQLDSIFETEAEYDGIRDRD